MGSPKTQKAHWMLCPVGFFVLLSTFRLVSILSEALSFRLLSLLMIALITEKGKGHTWAEKQILSREMADDSVKFIWSSTSWALFHHFTICLHKTYLW